MKIRTDSLSFSYPVLLALSLLAAVIAGRLRSKGRGLRIQSVQSTRTSTHCTVHKVSHNAGVANPGSSFCMGGIGNFTNDV